MAKRRKKMETVKEKDVDENDLAKQIENIAAGLYYTSETDAEIFPFTGSKAETASSEEILKQTKNKPDTPVQEKDYNDFFARLTEMQDWFGEEETNTANKFAELKKLFEANLKDIKVFKIGKIDLDVYVVGLDAESNLNGIKTKAVET